MTRRLLIRLSAVALALGFGVMPVVAVGPASANQVPPGDFNCGNGPPFTPCNQTAHFSDINTVGNPLTGTTPSGAQPCPPFISTDFPLIVGTGNGVEHSIVNKSGDGWFTSTFTGQVTITEYPPSSVTVDPNTGNASLNGGPADANVPVYTGKLTQWFGGSFNAKNMVVHSTATFSGTGTDNSTINVHDVSHWNTTPGTPPPPPPAGNMFEYTSC